MAKTYTFRTETYNKPTNTSKPTKPNEKFESKKAELYPVEYRDILNNCLVKLTSSTSSSNHSSDESDESDDLKYSKGWFQGDKMLLTYSNKLGHIEKEWLIAQLRTQLHTLDPSDRLDRNDGKKLKNKNFTIKIK